MLSGAVQSLATWWHDHREIPRTVLVDRAMEFCWHGAAPDAEEAFAGAAASERDTAVPPAARAALHGAPVGTPAL
jgi:hypothetical protein